MGYQPFLISAFTTGRDSEVQPWILPQDAFQSIINGYVHKGVISKRNGTELFQWMVRASTYTVSSITNANPGVITLVAAAGLSNGNFFQIRTATGMTEINNVTYQIANLVGNSFDIYDISGNPVDTSSFGVYSGGATFFTVPQSPIMGIKNFIDTDGLQQILIFDTERGAIFNAVTNVFDPLDSADIFDGTPASFINSASFGRTAAFSTSTFFFTNFNGDTTIPVSPMRQYTTGSTTSTFVPNTNPTGTANYVIASQFIFSIRARLLLLNTVESDTAPAGVPPTGSGTNYAQRMRWSRALNPAASGNNWDEITPGNGGFIDAPTSERIIGATQLEDTIIVQFSNSVWMIEPISDPAIPFRWVKVNNFRSCDAPYANIAHDRFVISFGKRGIVASDRTEVQRIDNKIEDFMAEEVNVDFINRMYSERNYTDRRSWTLYPSASDSLNAINESETSNFALIRTEEEGSWSIFNVAMTDIDPENGTNMSCLGYGRFSFDTKFDDIPANIDFNSSFADEAWDAYFSQSGSEIFLGGDQNGRVLVLERGGDDLGEDIDFEVTSAGWNPFKEQGVQAQLGYVDFYLDADTNTNFTVEFFADDITSPYSTQEMNCLPNLGYIADIVDIALNNPVEITSPSNGLSTGDVVFLYGINGTDELDGGPYTVTTIDEDTFSLDGVDGTSFASYTGGGQVVERSFENIKCWKRAYAGGKGYQHFIRITNRGGNDTLRFNAFMPWFRQAGMRMIGG